MTQKMFFKEFNIDAECKQIFAPSANFFRKILNRVQIIEIFLSSILKKYV